MDGAITCADKKATYNKKHLQQLPRKDLLNQSWLYSAAFNRPNNLAECS